MTWHAIGFGKHRDLTLPVLVSRVPSYFFWAFGSGAFRRNGVERFEEVCWKARHIRVPAFPDGREAAVDYGFDSFSQTLGHVEVVPTAWPRHDGGTRTERRPWLDLSFAYDLNNRDKDGDALLLAVFRRDVLGVKALRADRAEAFFDDDANFDMAGFCR